MYLNWLLLLSPNEGKEKFVKFPLDCARDTIAMTGIRKAKADSSSLAPTMIVGPKIEATIEEIDSWVLFTDHDWCPPSIESQKMETLPTNCSIWISSNHITPNRNLPLGKQRTQRTVNETERACLESTLIPNSSDLLCLNFHWQLCCRNQIWPNFSNFSFFPKQLLAMAHGYSKSCAINK